MMDFQKRWVSHLRSSHKQDVAATNTFQCPLCGKEAPPELNLFRSHVEEEPEVHAPWDSEEAIESAFKSLQARRSRDEHRTPRKRPVDDPADGDPQNPDSSPEHKKRSPPGSVDNQPEVSSSTPNPRSRARNTSGRQLWTDEDGTRSKEPQGRSAPIASHPSHPSQSKPTNKSARQSQPPPQRAQSIEEDVTSQMMLQPETRPISQDQLVAEVKGIYAGLVMVETKCIEVDNAQSSNPDANKLNNEQWQALIALHRTLLHEHHDFFLASQHPSASPPLKRLASKYAMPARMWRHGIHSFLELLRHRLPESLEHMLTFLYLAYSMMALLYETVPTFVDTWIECLGDLGRYRMAIEDDDIRDREVWTGVSRHWYSKASDNSPTTGRLYHHLAILARPNALQQLYYYTKSLCVPIPFLSAKESIKTLFEPILNPKPDPKLDPKLESTISKLTKLDTVFVRVHGILFSGKNEDRDKARLKESTKEFLSELEELLAPGSKHWLERGYFIGISQACSLLGYGDESSVLMNAITRKPIQADVTMEGSNISDTPRPPSEEFTQALLFAVDTYEVFIKTWGDSNVLPFLHTTLVFLQFMSNYSTAMGYIEARYPWKLTAILLNYLLDSSRIEPRLDGEFPRPEKDELPRPLPEDYAMRGLIYSEEYFPQGWFANEKIDEDEKFFELSSMAEERKERILYLGYQIAMHQKWIIFDESTRRFSVVSQYDVEVKLGNFPEELSKQVHSP